MPDRFEPYDYSKAVLMYILLYVDRDDFVEIENHTSIKSIENNYPVHLPEGDVLLCFLMRLT